jgi:branched-chain amino acid transport system substrate-binding protein
MQRRQIFSFTAQVAAVSALSAAPAFMRMARAQGPAGLSANSLVIGSSAALTGPLGGFGTEMKLGVDAAFAEANKKGGVHGRQLQFKLMDDAYVADRTVANVKSMVADGSAFALLSVMGTPNNIAAMPVMEQAAMPHLAPLTGATSLRRADARNTFHVRASYADETVRLVQQLVQMGIKSLAIVYLDNAFGKEVLADAQRVLKAQGIAATATVALATDGKNMADVVKATMDSKPAAVLLGTAGAASAGLVAALREASPRLPLAGLSVALTQDGVRKLGERASGIAMTMVFPDPYRARMEIVRQYQGAMRANGANDFGLGSLEAYINARVLIEGLQRSGRDVSRDKLRASLASMRKLELGGFDVDYQAAPFVASKFVDLGILTANGRMMG